MSEKEFKDYIGEGNLRLFNSVHRFKSVRRAIKRGHVSSIGEEYPKRPFNNRKSTKGRTFNERRKLIYEQLKKGGI